MATEIWIPIGISGCAVIIAFLAFWRAKVPKDLKSTEPDFQAFKLLSDEGVKKAKDDLIEEWCKKKPKGNATFSEGLKEQVRKVRDAYENVSSLYQLGLLNRNSFRLVYGNVLVSTYRLMKDEIEKMRSLSNNPNLCKNFEETAVSLITNYKINAEPFCPPQKSESQIDSMDMSESVKLTEKNKI